MSLELAEVVGQLAALGRFPVEPLGGESPDIALLQADGLVGERIRCLCDAQSCAPLSLAAAPRLLNYSARYVEDLVAQEFDRWARVRTASGKEYAMTDPQWLHELEADLGRRVILAPRRAQRPVAIHLLSRPTIRLAECAYGAPLDWRRMRANLIVEIPDGKAFEERNWIGRRIRIGDALLEINEAAPDCVVTSGPPDGTGDLDLLNAFIRVRGQLGLVARAIEGRRLRVGDPIMLVG